MGEPNSTRHLFELVAVLAVGACAWIGFTHGSDNGSGETVTSPTIQESPHDEALKRLCGLTRSQAIIIEGETKTISFEEHRGPYGPYAVAQVAVTLGLSLGRLREKLCAISVLLHERHKDSRFLDVTVGGSTVDRTDHGGFDARWDGIAPHNEHGTGNGRFEGMTGDIREWKGHFEDFNYAAARPLKFKAGDVVEAFDDGERTIHVSSNVKNHGEEFFLFKVKKGETLIVRDYRKFAFNHTLYLVQRDEGLGWLREESLRGTGKRLESVRPVVASDFVKDDGRLARNLAQIDGKLSDVEALIRYRGAIDHVARSFRVREDDVAGLIEFTHRNLRQARVDDSAMTILKSIEDAGLWQIPKLSLDKVVSHYAASRTNGRSIHEIDADYMGMAAQIRR